MPILCKTDVPNHDYRIPQFKSCCAWTGQFYSGKVWTMTDFALISMRTSYKCDTPTETNLIILLLLVSLLFLLSYKWLHHWLICLYVASFELGCQLVVFMGENSEGCCFTSQLHGKYGLARYTAFEFRFHSVTDSQLKLTNNVAAFFPFNLMWGGGWGGSDVCIFVHPSHDLQTFDSVCVHPSHDLHFWQCVHPPHDLQTHLTVFVFIHLITCSVWHYDSVCVDPSHDSTVTYYYWLCVCPAISWPAGTFDNVSIHLMTCRHFWQCLCSSIWWPADTFDNVCVHPSYDLQTLLTVFVSIHLMTCRHFWQFLCPSILWPADIFYSVFISIHLMTCIYIYFWQWALLSLDNTTFSFSVFYKLFWSRVQFDTDVIILYFRHHDKDTLSTWGT